MAGKLAASAAALVLGLGSAVYLATGSAATFDWNAAYQAAQPGDVISVPAGTYSGQTLTWRGDLAGKCDRANPASLIRFVPSGPVTVNGEVEVDGPCVGIIGSDFNVNGEVSAFGVAPNIPDNVLFQGFHAVHFGAFGADHVTFDAMDIGPATVVQNANGSCSASEGPGDENKIAGRWGSGGSNHTPADVVISNSRIHNQQGRNPDRGNCHYGGLFIVNVDGLRVVNTVFERNVVYHVQIQNFSGPAPTGIVFQGDSFGCPIDWLERGDVCDGQRAIQLNTSAPGVTAQLIGNASANGPSGLFGCYTPCDSSGVVESGTIVYPDSTTAPPLPGGAPPLPPPPPPPTTSTSTTTSTTTQTTTTPPPPPPACAAPALAAGAQSDQTSALIWPAIPGAHGFRFYKGGAFVSSSNNGALTSVRFGRLAYGVTQLGVGVICSDGEHRSDITTTETRSVP